MPLSPQLDVTNLHQATSALQESETRFRRLVELNPNAIVIQSDGQWRYANDTALRLFGVEEFAAFQARPVFEWIHPDSRGTARERMTRVLTGEPQPEQELLFQRADGSTFPAMVHGIEFAHEGSQSILGVIRDITQQKRTEAAIEKARDSYRSLMMEMPFLVWKGTPVGGCEYINLAWMDFTGLDLPQLIGHRWAERIHPEDQPALMQTYASAMADRQPMIMEFRMRHRSGEYRWVQGQGKPFYDLDGAFNGFLAACNDIHDHRMAEAALLEASRQRLSMLEAASVARVVPWSMGPDHRMQWGDSANLVLGRSPAVLAGPSGWPLDLIQEQDRPRLQQALRETEMGQVSSFECRMRHGRGHTIWTRWTLAHEQEFFHGAVQDITEQHAIQEQLLQSQKLECVGTLVGGIAHDFNNLLGAILGYCELFEVDPELDAKHLKGLGVIQGAARRGRELVGKLMGFSRKMAPNRVKSSLNGLVVEAADLASHALPSGIQLSLDLSPNLPDADLDPGQIHQVVLNLVINARDAIQGSGHITLRTGRHDIGPEAGLAHHRSPGPYAYLEVEDTGCGIPEDQLNRIFEPFYTTKGPNGTGLGLSMVYGLVTEHGGFMECQSQVGQGTLFRVMLPLDYAARGKELSQP